MWESDYTLHGSLLLSVASLFMLLATHSQLRKVIEIKHSYILSCVFSWLLCWNFTYSLFFLHGAQIMPLSSTFMLHILPSCQSLRHLSHPMDYQSTAVLAFKELACSILPSFQHVIMASCHSITTRSMSELYVDILGDIRDHTCTIFHITYSNSSSI